MNNSNFINLKFKRECLDIYYIRNSIFEAVKECSPQFHGTLLDIGCGKMPYREYIFESSFIDKYIGLDIQNAIVYDKDVRPDYTWDGITMPFANESFDCAFGTEVLEHCPEPQIVLKEVFRVLKPEGLFFFTVPFLWNLHEVPHDEYRYTPFSLERHLKNVGFSQISLKALGGWDASLAQMLGLWVRRSRMTKRRRKIFSILLKPIISSLIRKDQPVSEFKEGQMITGIYGIARKIKDINNYASNIR